MKKIALISLIAAFFVGFGYYTLLSTPANEAADKANADKESFAVEPKPETKKLAEPRKGTGSLESLRLLAENLECSISYSDDNQGAKIEGTYFVNNGDIRGDFLTPAPDLSGQILTSMIISNSIIYVWSEIEGQSYGTKTDLAAMSDWQQEPLGPIGLDVNVLYDCKPWPNVDRTIFEPPSDIIFNDANELMKAGMERADLYEISPEF